MAHPTNGDITQIILFELLEKLGYVAMIDDLNGGGAVEAENKINERKGYNGTFVITIVDEV